MEPDCYAGRGYPIDGSKARFRVQSPLTYKKVIEFRNRLKMIFPAVFFSSRAAACSNGAFVKFVQESSSFSWLFLHMLP